MNDDDDAAIAADSPPAGAVHIAPRRPTPLYAFLSSRLLRLEGWLQSHGGEQLRGAIRLFWAFLLAAGVFLLVGPVLNEPLSFDDITSSAGEATDTWIARSFEADYTLVHADDGRLALEVEERITAFFPEDVDESAVERVIATQYEGHDLRPELRGATLDGAVIAPTVRETPTRSAFVVDAGERLRGDHDVVLRYVLHDVAYSDQDPSSRELYDLLEWDAFGPEWSHGVAESSLTITVPRELVDAYARQPSSGIAWLLVGDSQTLTPDSETADAVVYRATNDQNLPPFASFWFALRFEAGTFTMPEPSALFWVQVIGPFVPLALLAATLLFSLAARRVAWADARGRSWFVAQDGPRSGSTPGEDARLWRARRSSALVDALVQYRSDRSDAAALRRLVRVARRTGRVGDIPHALSAYRSSRAWTAQFTDGLRRVPRGFVRDAFIGASVALTAVQWGLVRQLSYQVTLTVYWWPVAIVVVSTVLAATVLAIALTARPLTRAGTLAVEHLRGQELFVEQTSAADRTPLRDRLLPYVVMFERPRRAGRLVTEMLDREGLSQQVSEDPRFVTTGRLIVRVAAVVAVVAACVLVATTTAGTRHALGQNDVLEDVEGDYGVYVSDVDIEASLSRGPNGEARLEVVEKLEADTDENLRAIPQVTRVWRDQVDGHDQSLTVDEITVDGEAVPFEQSRVRGHAVVQTRLSDEWPGEHDIEVRYTLTDAASALHEGVASLDAVRWTALLPWWDWTWEGVDHEPERLRVAVTMPPELADSLVDGSGWLDELAHRKGRPPIGFSDPTVTPDRVVFAFDERVDDEYDAGSLWPSGAQYGGAQLLFPDGTFTGPSEEEWARHTAWQSLPWLLSPALALIAIGLSVVGVMLGPVRLARRGKTRDLVRWMPPALTAAQLPLLVWASADAYSEDPLLAVLLVSLAASIIATWVVLARTRSTLSADTVMTWHRKGSRRRPG
ncbi:hypothetical protein ACFXQA_12610 [Microbacterium sp. P07]|uniref:hypothetical protein n=1 Tax=Microbacterium sp. P07 TaxID=3366952 RepID=UPI0037474047